ncbi:MAG: hypothetical protein ACRDQH_09370, partial [Pseudonocardiaceae bacterium]
MSVYVAIDVHRKRSQVAVVDEAGRVLKKRNATKGVDQILSLISTSRRLCSAAPYTSSPSPHHSHRSQPRNAARV